MRTLNSPSSSPRRRGSRVAKAVALLPWIPAGAGMTIGMVGMTMGVVVAPAAAQRVATFPSFQYSGKDASDVVPARPGDYRNPILKGFYPDPSVTRVGDDFYLVTSTFSWFPGIPVFHSRDLVHWTQIGNAIDRPGMLDFKRLGLSRGVFAPSIQAKDGTFYLLNTCVDCGGNFLLTARNPAGPWSDPVWLPDLEGGIDPSMFFDDDGRAWVVNNGPTRGQPLYEGHRAIWVQEFDRGTRKTFGPRTLLVDGGIDISKKPVWIEGPHIFKKDGWYYLSCAEGGTAEGHSQVILRSRSVTGPYAAWSGNPILTQRDLPRDRPHPITSAGHAQLVTTPDGKWWATFLAVRPYAGDFYTTGRETFLLPVEWKDGWPVILPPATPIPGTHARPALPRARAPLPTAGAFTIRDDFRGKLPPHWMMLRNPRDDWYRTGAAGLSLVARPIGLGDNANPSFLARRQQHIDAVAETVVQFAPEKDGDRAGLVVLQNDDYWFFVGRKRVGGKDVVTVDQREGPASPKLGRTLFTAPAPAGALRLRIAVQGRSYAFSYAAPGGKPAWQRLGTVETDSLTTKVAGGFVGSVFGLFAGAGE